MQPGVKSRLNGIGLVTSITYDIKNKIISLEEKRTIAFHEAGHATVSWLLKYASPLVKVTIIPRGRASP